MRNIFKNGKMGKISQLIVSKLVSFKIITGSIWRIQLPSDSKPFPLAALPDLEMNIN
jgi:hypothetical protein